MLLYIKREHTHYFTHLSCKTKCKVLVLKLL
nr:MAG TPA: hypothetical protein [Caudoviricetes sp.]